MLEKMKAQYIYQDSKTLVRADLLLEAAKKSPNQETGLGNRGHLKVMNDTKFDLNEHE